MDTVKLGLNALIGLERTEEVTQKEGIYYKVLRKTANL